MNPLEIVAKEIRTVETIEQMETLLAGVLSECKVDASGAIVQTRKLVERVEDRQMEIHPREHAPPHYHVVTQEFDASFEILRFVQLDGHIPQNKRKVIEFWCSHARNRLVQFWNDTRLADCPMGPIAVNFPLTQ